jgi:2-polyprenyl-6-methoxyphenol hydroxylase-like FAD-dependent oxidoreductase
MSELLKVLIAGGGIGGLSLAQGLGRAGVECEVFEREPRDGWRSGYLLNLDDEGDSALSQCLAPELYELFVRACSRTTRGHDLAVVADSQGIELSSMKHIGAPSSGERPPTGIDRRTFRHILLAGLDDVVHHGAEVAGFEAGADSVTVRLADGRAVAGDVLVAADGVGSAVRRQLLPDVPIVPAPVGALGLFGRSPLTEDLADGLPDGIYAAFTILRDERGTLLGLGRYHPRRSPPEAADELGLDIPFDDVRPYMMLSGGIPHGMPVPPPTDWTTDTPRQMHEAMAAAVADWHPAIRGIVARVELDTLFSHPFKRLDPAPAWPSSRVTLVGDAIHAMLPTLGKGANMAMRNAAVLRDQLVAAERGERPLLEAIAAYEADMRAATYPLMELASDHESFGGGGLRQSETNGAPATVEEVSA